MNVTDPSTRVEGAELLAAKLLDEIRHELLVRPNQDRAEWCQTAVTETPLQGTTWTATS